ncbi:MAG TPA: xanthine dehydrogenase family protein subunit M [Candidatus Binataceae bacterium]|nr:xanthine dehydrogenase family protein subunit M [Candidatus Binataceae bacterium]
MHAFSYEAPTTVADAVKLLAAGGSNARVLCGGTDLLIQMRNAVRKPLVLVDVKLIPEMRQISYDAKTGLRLGAAVPCIEIEESEVMHKHYPGLTEGAHLIGSLQIQSRASIGGNLCNASPAADTSPSLLALGATARIAGPKGTREVAVENFFTGPGANVLQPGELVVEILIPAPAAHSSDRYIRMIPRNEMDIAIVGAGVSVTLDGDKVKAARIALAAVAPTPLLVPKAAESLIGKKLDEKTATRAGELASEAASPIDDMRGTAEYRKHVTGVLTRRALLGAAERAEKNGR